MKNKKYAYAYSILAVLIVAAVVVLVIVWHKKPMSNTPAGSTNQTQNNIPGKPSSNLNTQTLSSAQLADALPSGFPTESGSTLLQNSQTVNSQDNSVTVLRTTTTAKKPADNLKIYQDWMSKNGWTVSNTINVPTLMQVAAAKASQTLKVTFAYDGGSKSQVVVVNLTTQK